MKDALCLDQTLALLDNTPDPLLLLDADDRVVGGNSALRNLLGAATDTLMGRRAADLVGSPVQALLTGNETFCYLAAGDQPAYFLPLDVRLPPGAAAVRARVLRDVTDSEHLRVEREHLQDELRAQALHDPVTGLLNRRGFMVAVEPQVSRSRRYSSPLSIVVMDVHAAGADDAFAVRVSRVLKDQLRWADVIGVGEDRSFILVLPETRRDDALVATDKLNERLAHEFGADAAGWAAYGVVEWQKTDNANTLLRRALSALDQARIARDGGRAAAL